MKLPGMMMAIVLPILGVGAVRAAPIVTNETCLHLARPDQSKRPQFLVALDSVTVDGVAFDAGNNISPGIRGKSGTDLFELLLAKCLHMTAR